MSRRSRLSWLVLCAAALAAGAARAQEAPSGARLAGRVVEARTGDPVPGALVRVLPGNASVTSGNGGDFSIDGLPVTTVTVQVVMIGYALLERQVDLAVVGTGLTFALSEAPPAYTEQVEVRGDPFNVAATTSPSTVAIGSTDLALLRGVLADDPFRAVQAMPGVAGGDDFTAEFSIRGSGPEHVGVLIDGVPAPVVLHTVQGRNDTGSVSMINSDLLEQVAVSGGAYTPRTGNRTGAQVEFLTREGSRERTQLRGLVGAAVASVVGEGPIGGGRGSWLVAGRASYAGWIARRIDPSTTTTFTFLDTNAKVTWDVTPAQRASLVLVAGRMFVSEHDPGNGINSLADGVNDSVFAVGSWRWQARPGLAVSQKGSVLYNRFQNLNNAAAELGRGRVQGGSYRGALSWAPREQVLVETGASVDLEWRDLLLRRLRTTAPTVVVTDRVRDHDERVGAYAVATWSPSRRYSWTAGLRADAFHLASWASATPFGSVSTNLSDRWSLRAGAGQYVQSPSIEQLAGLRGESTLEPVTATHVDLSAEWRPRADLRWVAGAYQRTEDEGLRLPESEPRIVNGRVRPASATSVWENRLDTTSRGLELLVQRHRAVGVSGWIAYGYALTHDRDAVTGERYAGDYDQRHTLNMYLSWRASHRTGASLKYRFGSSIPVTGYYNEGPTEDGEPTYVLGSVRNDARYPYYSRLDVRLQRSFIRGARRLTLFVEALNLLNHDNYGPAGAGNAESLFPILPSAGLLVEF